MKRFIFLILILSIIVSCGKKEEEENRNNIVGTWVGISQIISNCTEDRDNSNEELDCTESGCITYTFDAEGIYISNITIQSETFGEQGTYAVKDETITFCQEDDEDLICLSGSYDVSTNSLILTTTDEETGCTTQLIFDRSTETEEEEEEEPA